MGEEHVFFNSVGTEPLQLEGVIHTPTGEASPCPGVLVCHPHSLHGGSKDVPVIAATARALAKRGMVSLRFNFRGVGRSEGSFGEGVAEVDDVAGAVDYLLSLDGVAGESVYLMGYSFGAAVGLRHVEADPRISAVAALCLPLGSMTIGVLDDEFWQGYVKPKLFLAGDRDDICPLRELRSLVDELPEPKQLTVLDGADHFLWGREEEVAEHIADYLEALS